MKFAANAASILFGACVAVTKLPTSHHTTALIPTATFAARPEGSFSRERLVLVGMGLTGSLRKGLGVMLTEEMIADGWRSHDGGPCPVPMNSRPWAIGNKYPGRQMQAPAGIIKWQNVIAYKPETPHAD